MGTKGRFGRSLFGYRPRQVDEAIADREQGLKAAKGRLAGAERRVEGGDAGPRARRGGAGGGGARVREVGQGSGKAREGGGAAGGGVRRRPGGLAPPPRRGG